MNCPACQAPVVETQPFCSRCGAALPKVATSDPLIGQVFAGRYKIVKLLGEGGMGCVYLAEQALGTNVRKVALKTLHRHLSNDEAIRERFQREVGTVAELEHPNTIHVFDFGTAADGQLFIVMEFVQGESLAAALTKAKFFSPDRTKRVLSQVCGALAEAHQHGIVHRDLKPDNVILTKRAGQEDFVKLLDFGIAKRSAEADVNEKKLTQQGMVLGTPPYMSPEQFTGRAVDARSDIYAIGVMAYEMLTGELPFKADTAWEWATQHMREAPRPIEGAPHGGDVPRPMRKAISRALSKAPEDRFATVGDFFQAFAGEPTQPGSSVKPPGAPEGKGGTLMGEPLGAVAAAGLSPAPIGFPSGAPRPGGTEAGGTPLIPPASYVASAVPAGNGTFVPGASYSPSPSAPAYGPTPHHVTPPAGNHAFPTPHAVPRAPAYTTSNGKQGGGRRGLLIAAGVIGLLSIGAVAIALYVESGPTPVVVTQPFPTTPVATATETSTGAVTSEPTTPTATPTLGGTTPSQPLPTSPSTPTTRPTTKPSTSPTPSPTPVPTPTPKPTQTLPFPLPTFVPTAPPTPTPTPTPVPTPVPTPAPTPNAASMAQKCQEARAKPPGPMREFEVRKYCQ